jgi:AcrR family transcriptional regulator
VSSFQRARKPEQKDLRRNTILDAARELAREVGPMALGLNELGRRSGVSKPNIYRYFESREDVLLQLLVSELEEAVADMERGLDRCNADVRALAACIAETYLTRPLLCQLLGMVAAILEHNLSREAIVASKQQINALSARIAGGLARARPGTSLEDAAWLTHSIALYVAGLWPAANPSPIAAEVLAQPEFQGLRPQAHRDLQRVIEVLILGLEASRPRSR